MYKPNNVYNAGLVMPPYLWRTLGCAIYHCGGLNLRRRPMHKRYLCPYKPAFALYCLYKYGAMQARLNPGNPQARVRVAQVIARLNAVISGKGYPL